MPRFLQTIIWLVMTTCLIVPDVYCKKMNVLFLVADDMRPELGCFEGPDAPSPIHPTMHTPNLDGLASQSLLMKKAYVQQALCSPSRTSLLTGRRPDTTHVYDLVHYFRVVGGNFTTIPQYFKENGYTSVGMGKIFHPGAAASDYDDPMSWSEPYFHAPNMVYWQSNNASWRAISKHERAEKELPDIQITNHAVQTLRRLANEANSTSKPFFAAVGIHKPHLPFVFPEEFLQFYPVGDISLPNNSFAPVNMPPIAWYNYAGLRNYADIARLNASGKINTSLPNDVVRDLRRAYYSALTYTDSLIGILLRELKALGLWNSTIVSFWGDHGWQLGEHGEWCKQTNFELATHAPMMVKVPGLTEHGIVTEELTEFVDLFPTLVEAAGLPELDVCPENSATTGLCREGQSLMPLVRGEDVNWKQRVFSQYPRGSDIMGYTMRTKLYRYTEWVRFQGAPHYKADWTSMHGVELYDHEKDPEENYNAAYDASYESIRKALSLELRAGWRHATDDSV